ncbi:MAG: sulfur carrier protein ThiS [Planctomycetes bacterium]|nr:sulfur carrier protein ThiS [Planctomycetota bacterium]
MHITLNGEPETLDDGATVAGLLRKLKLDPVRVAVELNEDVLTRKTFADTRIGEGDCVEIVTFVGGG